MALDSVVKLGIKASNWAAVGFGDVRFGRIAFVVVGFGISLAAWA